MKLLRSLLFATGLSLSSGAIANGDIYLSTTEDLLTNDNSYINAIKIPADMTLDDGRLASGPQTVKLTNRSESEAKLLVVGSNSIPVTLNAGDSISYNSSEGGAILDPGSSTSFEINLEAGDSPKYVQIRPVQNTDGDILKYELTLQELRTVWDTSGWQTLYSDGNGCRLSECPIKTVYGAFNTVVQEVKYAATAYCSTSGYRLNGTKCKKTVTVPPTWGCSYGYTMKSGICEKTTYTTPRQECPRNKFKKGSSCYDTYQASCPSTHYLSNESTDGHCYPNSTYVDIGTPCPSSHPYAGGSNTTHTTCYKVDTGGGPGRNARVESVCRGGDVGGGGYGGSPFCYNPSKGSATVSTCSKGTLNPSTGKCESITTKQPSQSCSTGSLSGGMCKEEDIRNADYRCTSGDRLVGTTCRNSSESNQSYVSSTVRTGTTLLKVKNKQ